MNPSLQAFLVTALTSNLAIVFYAAAVLYAWNWLKKHEGWDTERWEGLVLTAFNAAEQWGFTSKIPGESKLRYALGVFATEYQKTHGVEPSAKDLRDAALDFARYAYDLKFSAPPVVTAPASDPNATKAA